MARATNINGKDEFTTSDVGVKAQPERKVKKQLDNNLLVPVSNNTDGTLVYVSKRTGQNWVFEKYGDEDVIELHELRTMASSQRRFFEDNWINILDEEVIEYLRLERFYEKNLSEDELDGLFDLSVEEVADVIAKASANVKSLILGKARHKYENGRLTNIHIIQLLEEKFNTTLKIE